MSNGFVQATNSGGDVTTMPASNLTGHAGGRIPVVARDPATNKPTVYYTPQQKVAGVNKLQGLAGHPNVAASANMKPGGPIQISAVQRQFLLTEQRMKDMHNVLGAEAGQFLPQSIIVGNKPHANY